MPQTLAQKFEALKTKVGGNREVFGYEDSFGQPRLEQWHVTPPAEYAVRILGELEFAIRLSGAEGGKYDGELHAALDYLAGTIESEGALTKSACAEAEEILSPLAPAAKEYKLILAGHAHIDMNWMWSWARDCRGDAGDLPHDARHHGRIPRVSASPSRRRRFTASSRISSRN